jgi:NTE family protein
MQSPTAARTGAPPRIALVLGSGGIRSVASLGVADVLHRAGLKPDVVVGCSSGAIFGACIAMQMTAEESLKAVAQLWSQDLTERRRWRAYIELIAPKLMGFNAGFSLRDARWIARRIDMAFGERRLESLPTPLRVVTTDSLSGGRVVLSQGRVTDALRASIALPFLFPSVEIDGRRFSDGVLSDPLPVSAAQDAELTIALGFRGSMPRRIDRPSRLVAQVSTAMINNLQEARLIAAQAQGQKVIHIDLELDRRIGLWETRAVPRIFIAGKRATERKLDEICSLLGMQRPQVAA